MTQGSRPLAEVTLVLVLFCDASRVGLRDLRADMWLCVRLLVIGLPLTIGLGTLLAWAMAGGASFWLALLVGATLAPTDAALGAGMMVNAAVPARIRRLINGRVMPLPHESRLRRLTPAGRPVAPDSRSSTTAASATPAPPLAAQLGAPRYEVAHYR